MLLFTKERLLQHSMQVSMPSGQHLAHHNRPYRTLDDIARPKWARVKLCRYKSMYSATIASSSSRMPSCTLRGRLGGDTRMGTADCLKRMRSLQLEALKARMGIADCLKRTGSLQLGPDCRLQAPQKQRAAH